MSVEDDIGSIVQKAKIALATLPAKPGNTKWKTVACQLEDDFRQARAKGYGFKEISELLKEADIPIPAYLVKRFSRMRGIVDAPRAPRPERGESETNRQLEKDKAKTQAPTQTESEKGMSEAKLRQANGLSNPMDDTLVDQFTLTPDTPDGEL